MVIFLISSFPKFISFNELVNGLGNTCNHAGEKVFADNSSTTSYRIYSVPSAESVFKFRYSIFIESTSKLLELTITPYRSPGKIVSVSKIEASGKGRPSELIIVAFSLLGKTYLYA